MHNTPPDELQDVLSSAWPSNADQPRIVSQIDVSEGRGVFSRVFALELDWLHSPTQASTTDFPTSVVVKLAALGPNRQAAITSGAYSREAQAYTHILQQSPIAVPICYGISTCGDGAIDFVLEDLRSGRLVDQIEGLSIADAKATASQLGVWHHRSRRSSLQELGRSLNLRQSTPSLFPTIGLERGLQALREQWADLLSEAQIRNFERLVSDRHDLLSSFERHSPSLCHGDVRADNLVFGYNNHEVVFYDWQQTALQLGEADLAWLCATSLVPEVRRKFERQLVQVFADTSGSQLGPTWDRYRSALLLPGLAVLFLAQRELITERTRNLVAASLIRIAEAISDHELA